MNTNQLQYENSNTENLINEIYRINPNVKFNTFGNVVSEKEAMMLYRAITIRTQILFIYQYSVCKRKK